jgi:hypothetical protein
MAANDVSLNNPAGRLHRILSRAKSSGQPTLLGAFAHALEIPPTNISEILANLGQLGLAVDQVSEALKRINDTDNLEEYLDSAPHLKSALSIQSLGATWESYKNHIRDEDLRALRYCSKALSKKSLEVALSEEQIKQLKEGAEALYEDVLSSTDVDPQLRGVILGHIDSILRAIHEYRIKGLRPLAEALSITGLTLTSVPEVKPTEEDSPTDSKRKKRTAVENVRQWVKDTMLAIKFWHLVSPLIFATGTHVPQLTEGIKIVKDLLS